MDHLRNHRSVLAPIEKRLLIRIARRLPSWIGSDHLTALALGAMCAAGMAAAAIGTRGWTAWPFVLALVLNWFGDSLDGTLARVRGHERPRYGYYVDHLGDVAGAAALLIGLGASGLMSPLVALVALAAYLMVAAETYLAAASEGTLRLSCAGIGPTELRIVLAIGVAFAASDPWTTILQRRALLLDIGGIAGAVGLGVVFVVSAVRNAAALYAAEPLPSPLAASRKQVRL